MPRSRSAGAEPKLIEFHIMRLTASPAKLVGIVRAPMKRRRSRRRSSATVFRRTSKSCVPRGDTHTSAFAKVGEALYEPSWRAALAQALEVSECNYITEFPRPIVAQPQRPMD